ncbi:hypothetical protein HDU67_005826, partial [Dinochytrium kinnereticum]
MTIMLPDVEERDLNRLNECLTSALAVSEWVVVAVPAIDASLIKSAGLIVKRAEEEIARQHQGSFLNASGEIVTPKAMVVQVSDWGNFIPALNHLVHVAGTLGMERICFRSIEVMVNEKEMSILHSSFDDETLVVGKRLTGHKFTNPETTGTPAIVPLTGTTCPWNTLAIWD